jgi:hypothetical protein
MPRGLISHHLTGLLIAPKYRLEACLNVSDASHQGAVLQASFRVLLHSPQGVHVSVPSNLTVPIAGRGWSFANIDWWEFASNPRVGRNAMGSEFKTVASEYGCWSACGISKCRRRTILFARLILFATCCRVVVLGHVYVTGCC